MINPLAIAAGMLAVVVEFFYGLAFLAARFALDCRACNFWRIHNRRCRRSHHTGYL